MPNRRRRHSCIDSIVNLSYHFANELARRRALAEASPGLRRARPADRGRPHARRGTSAKRSRPGATVRRLAHHGGACVARPADGRPGGAPRRVWHVRAGAARGDARAGLWRADAGSRRRRGVRRDLSRPARSPRGAAARAGVGQPAVDLDVESRSRVAALRAVHRAPGGRRVLRADRADGGQGLGEPAHRRCAGRGPYSGGAHRPRHRAVSAQGASRPGRPGQPARRRAGDRASAVGWMHASGVSGAAQRGLQRRWARSGIS